MKTRLLIISGFLLMSWYLPPTFAQYIGDVNSSDYQYEERLGTSVSKFAQMRSSVDDESYADFRDSKGETICKGYSSGGEFLEYPECGPVDQFVIHVLIIILSVAVIISGFVVWRKRK